MSHKTKKIHCSAKFLDSSRFSTNLCTRNLPLLITYKNAPGNFLNNKINNNDGCSTAGFAICKFVSALILGGGTILGGAKVACDIHDALKIKNESTVRKEADHHQDDQQDDCMDRKCQKPDKDNTDSVFHGCGLPGIGDGDDDDPPIIIPVPLPIPFDNSDDNSKTPSNTFVRRQ